MNSMKALKKHGTFKKNINKSDCTDLLRHSIKYLKIKKQMNKLTIIVDIRLD